MLPRTCRVTGMHRETRDTFTLELESVEGPPVPFAPGQFNMLYVFGVGEVPISMSGDPARPESLAHTVRAVGAVTDVLVRAKEGDVVGVRGPFGNGWPMEGAQECDLVIAAGGIGLAPLRPVIYEVLANRDRYDRVILLYGARTPQEMIYRRELNRWRGRFDMEVEITVDSAPARWRGDVGVLTTLIPHARFDPEHTVAFTCGPEIMIHFTARELQKRGVALESIYVSMERNMKCAIGTCGHCQLGPEFICKDGPVFRYDRVEPLMRVREM
jgi:NAD(P)H-flavin reductase